MVSRQANVSQNLKEWGEHFSWREHEGRGYWRGDRWTEW
jgi:hypothetical protein